MLFVLKKYKHEEIVSGIYYTITLLRHLESITSLNFFVNKLTISQPEKELIKSLVSDIEKTLKRKIITLTNKEANHYILELSKLAEESSINSFGQNKKKGQELLKKLRQRE